MTESTPNAGPLHGFRGTSPNSILTRPKSFTIAISREAGSRGSMVAAAVGRVLGWPVFPQEMLDFLAHDEAARADILHDLPPGAVEWAGKACDDLVAHRQLDPTGDTAAVTRLMFTLAARGEAILVGRGAGFVLPRDSTVHVRMVAGHSERVAYLAQWLRLSEAEAAEEVRQRDHRREQFLATLTDDSVTQATNYDLVINSSQIGVETAAELIAIVVRGKQLSGEPAEEWGTA